MYPMQPTSQQPQRPPQPPAQQNGPQAAATTVTSKGTVITRYPPPPGYKGPAAAPQPTHQRRLSAQAQAYAYNPAAFPNYPPPPQSAAAPAYQGHNAQPHTPNAYYGQGGYQGYEPQAAYPPPTGFPPQAIYPAQNGYLPPANYPPQNGYAPPPGQQAPSAHLGVPGYYATPFPAASDPAGRHSTVSTSSSAVSQSNTHHDGHRIVDPAKEEAAAAATTGIRRKRTNSDTIHPDQASDWAALSDPKDECYFGRHPEEIDRRFDLPLVVYNRALPTNSPLPPTFREAELEALAPRKPKALDEPVSEYFTKDKVEAQLNSIRHSDQWPEVKDDLVFKELPLCTGELISRTEMREKWLVRFDPNWSTHSDLDTTPGAMDIAYETRDRNGADDPLYDLQQALFDSSRRNSKASHRRSTSVHSNHSAAHSTSSRHSRTSSRYRALHPVRDEGQEDLLARLGVTGSPKTVYETPGPAFGPPAGSRHSSRHSSVSSSHDRPSIHPYPPIYEEVSKPNDVWNWQQAHLNGNHRPSSTTSQHTAAGSDFDPISDNEATPKPKQQKGWNTSDNRKRGYHDDEETPKQRRKQQRVSGIWERQ